MFRGKKMNRGLLLIGVLIFCIGFVFTAPGTTMAAPKGKVVHATSGDQGMRGGDGHTGTGARCTTLISLLHGKLLIKDKDGALQPDLANSWDVGPNWSSITFHLNKQAKFHDGVPVTAEDVKFSFARAMRPELKFTFGGEMRRKIDRVEIVDKHTVTVYNKTPYPALLDRASAYICIVPKHYLEKVGDVEYSRKTIGAGPFKMVSYKQDVFTEVEAVTEHYRKVPNVKTVRYTNVQEDTTRVAQLRTGEIDMAKLPYGTFWQVKGDPDIRIKFSKYAYLATLAYYDLPFPKEGSPFHDIRVRTAASLAINRKLICEKVLKGLNTPWGDLLAPYHYGYDPNLKPDPYDPEKAKELLREAGYPNGFKTEIVGGPAVKTECQAIAASLSKVGIIAKINVPEAGIWSRMVREKKVRGLGRHPGPWWVGRFHPASAWNSHLDSRSPWHYYNTPKVDEDLAELEKLTKKEEIAAKARALSKYYREERIRSVLWVQNVPFGVRKRVTYWEQTPGWVFAVLFEYLKVQD
jgi:peptide/nickel transport system substrate-binding protein